MSKVTKKEFLRAETFTFFLGKFYLKIGTYTQITLVRANHPPPPPLFLKYIKLNFCLTPEEMHTERLPSNLT